MFFHAESLLDRLPHHCMLGPTISALRHASMLSSPSMDRVCILLACGSLGNYSSARSCVDRPSLPQTGTPLLNVDSLSLLLNGFLRLPSIEQLSRDSFCLCSISSSNCFSLLEQFTKRPAAATKSFDHSNLYKHGFLASFIFSALAGRVSTSRS
jgi:hypothetical protein